MFNKIQWVGKEVEGRLSDIMTYFVRDLYNDTENKLHVNNINEYPHYYFTIEYVKKIKPNNEYFNLVKKILDTSKCYITMEINDETFESFPKEFFNKCHLIYRISDKYVNLLKKTDTISIDADWYRVHQITKQNMLVMTPDDYKYDVEV